jgi:peptidoglycan/xylan/chitin deacetylase (PgdA/CDA1 family)
MRVGLRQRVAQLRPVGSGFAGWPGGHRAALSLSFDDARSSQIACGLPVLDRLGISATFFVLPGKVAEAVPAWRDALAAGHEIGNHTTTHPCSGNFAWSRGNALERMTVAAFKAEVSHANRQLRDLLGVEPRAFAYPCGHTFVGRGRRARSVVPLISRLFEVGRTFNDVVANSPGVFDPAQVACVNCDEQTFDQLLPTLESAAADGAWLVFGGHEIGDTGERETTAAATIEAVVAWCRSNNIWIDTVGTISRAATATSRR